MAGPCGERRLDDGGEGRLGVASGRGSFLLSVALLIVGVFAFYLGVIAFTCCFLRGV